MKKLVILLIVALPLMMVGCFGEGTELGWTNADNSDGVVTKVKWSGSTNTYTDTADQTWSTEIAQDASTGMKSVEVLNGQVFADLDPDLGGAIIEDASLELTDSSGSGSSISLTEGNSERYTISVYGSKRK